MTSVWTNLVSYDHPYNEHIWVRHPDSPTRFRARRWRAETISRALAYVPNLQTLYVPRAYYIAEKDVVLNALKNPSLKRIYNRLIFTQDTSYMLEAAINDHPQLREIIHLLLPGPWANPVYAPIGDRTLSEIWKKFTFFTHANLNAFYLRFHNIYPTV